MIIQGQCSIFLLNKLLGAEDFSTGAPYIYHIALYTANATLDSTTLAYTHANEVVGVGYIAGGKSLTPITPALSGNVAYTSFVSPVWTGVSFVTRGALIYNYTSLAAVAVLDFGSDKIASGTFTVTFPPATATTAVIRDTTL